MKTVTRVVLTSVLLPFAASLAHAAPAAENWENLCASCHGSDGKGQTKKGKKMNLRDYTDAKVQDELKDADMIAATTDGVTKDGKERMKGFKADVSPEEIKDLVAYIRNFKPKP